MDHLRMLERRPDLAAYMAATPDAAYVDISDAMEWYWSESDQENWDVHDDLYRLTAPANITWLEYSAPTKINEGGMIKRWPLEIQRIGARVICAPIPVELREEAIAIEALEQFLCMVVIKAEAGEAVYDGIRADPEHLVHKERNIVAGIVPMFCLGMETFIQVNNRVGLSTWWAAYLNDDGRAYDTQAFPGTVLTLSPMIMDAYVRGELTGDEMQEASSGMATPFCFALSLMNCRNVERIADPRQLHRHERRRIERLGLPAIKYEWLKIKGLKRQAEIDGSSAAGGHAKKRLHQVRANWATYSPDAPLFGKYDGAFFRPQHARGSVDAGRVVKGYELLSGGRQ